MLELYFIVAILAATFGVLILTKLPPAAIFNGAFTPHPIEWREKVKHRFSRVELAVEAEGTFVGKNH